MSLNVRYFQGTVFHDYLIVLNNTLRKSKGFSPRDRLAFVFPPLFSLVRRQCSRRVNGHMQGRTEGEELQYIAKI